MVWFFLSTVLFWVTSASLVAFKAIYVSITMGFPGGSVVKNLQCRRRRSDSFDPWVGKITWSRKWKPSSISHLENSMVRGAWRATVHGVAKSWTWPSIHAHVYNWPNYIYTFLLTSQGIYPLDICALMPDASSLNVWCSDQHHGITWELVSIVGLRVSS